MYEEDLELSHRIRKLGWGIVYVPASVVAHRVQGSLRGDDQPLVGKWSWRNPNFDFHAYHMARNKLLNAFIHARGWNALVFAASYPVYLAVKLAPHCARLRFAALMPVLRGLFAGIRAYFSRKRHAAE